MTKKKYLLFSLVILSVFLYGLSVGHYEIFPFELISTAKFTLTDTFPPERIDRHQIYQELTEIDSLIDINSKDDIETKRIDLQNYIWPNGDLPENKFPTYHSININDNLFSDIESLSQIDSFTVEMEYGMTSTSYLFLPKTTNNQLIILHQGHDKSSLRGPDSHSFEQDKEIIQKFLEKNFSVLIFSMPGKGMNNEPVVEVPKLGKIKLNSHNHFRLIDNDNLHSIKFFIEPVMITLNQIDRDYIFESFNMVGLSGGGWSTVVISALDDRIKKSYSIAGSFPIWMRSSPSDLGDYEQNIPEFYKIANYEELYIMSAYGEKNKLVLIYNEFDPCCFPGSLYKQFPFESIIQERIKSLGKGEFSVIIDIDQNKHIISDFSLNQIFSSLSSK